MSLRRWMVMMTAAMQGAGAAAAAWTPASPTTGGGVSAHTYFDLETGLYQDSAKTTPVASDGDVVGAEVNQGSDTYDVVQATVDNKPIYKTNILNGKPMLLLDGVNDYLRGAFGGGELAAPYTVFVVAQLDATAVNDGITRPIFNGDDVTHRSSAQQESTTTPDKWSIYSGFEALAGTSNSDNNWHIWAILFNGASSQFWLDGVSEASGNPGAEQLDGLTIGSNIGISVFWKGYRGKLLIYPGNISTADKNQVGQYLADFYGLTWTAINP